MKTQWDCTTTEEEMLEKNLYPSLITTLTPKAVVNSREFSPFVIQIDDSTGMATIVNPISSEIL
ncbi:MAG: hypothetical protein ACEY3E_06590, partial [Candidatus Tisiphia sp.]